MITKIFKHDVMIGFNVVICGEIVHFGEQNGEYFIWAKSTRCGDKVVRLFMTGEEFEDTYLKHLGTLVSDDFVIHAFCSE